MYPQHGLKRHDHQAEGMDTNYSLFYYKCLALPQEIKWTLWILISSTKMDKFVLTLFPHSSDETVWGTDL
jgi:hypothetical protein